MEAFVFRKINKRIIKLFLIIAAAMLIVIGCAIENSSGGSSGEGAISGGTSSESTIMFYDDFTAATDSTLLTTSYTGYTTNTASPASPMYIKVGGTTVSVSSGQLTLTGARLSIGASASTATTSTSTPGGCFNLSSTYTVKIGIVSASGSGNFQVMVDNNTTSGSASPLGSDSRFYSTAVGSISSGELTITGVTATTTSFICLRTESSATVVVDYINIVGGSGSGTSSSDSSGSTSSNSSSTSSTISSSSSSVTYSVPSSTGSPVGYANAGSGTTGGAGGSTVYVSTGDELQAAIDNRATISTPLIIYVTGAITLDNTALDYILLKGSNDTKLVENLSIIGIGTSGELNGIGFKIWRVKNIIIQNLKIHHVLYNTGEGDGVNICGPASNIWIDHCEFYNAVGDLDGDGTVGDDDDKDYYDGMLDIKYEGSQYITVSNNIFHDGYKTSLIGYTTSDARDWYITFYANYYYNCNSRLPLIRGGGVHVLNNYYYSNTGSGTNNRCGLTNLIEGNFYQNSRDVIGWFYGDVTGYWDLGPGTTDSNYYDNVSWTAISGDIYATALSTGFLDTGTFSPGYTYTAMSAADVSAYVLVNAGVGKL